MPFRVNREGTTTYVSTTSTLDKPKQYRLTVQANIYDDNNIYKYSTKDIIFISVSAYNY